MKNLGFKKKNLIALTLATILTVGLLGVQDAKAAVNIDTSKQCSITFTADVSYETPLKVKLYKVADVKENGEFANAKTDLSALSGNNVDADTVKALAVTAYAAVQSETPQEITLEVANGKQSKKVDVDRGLYLYVPQEYKTPGHGHTADKYLVMVPYSTTIASTTVDADGNPVYTNPNDEWIYNADVNLKYDEEEEFGSLKINKTLKTYNESLGTAAFTYKVEAKDGDKILFSDVYSAEFNFDKPGTQSYVITNIPANIKVTVTEVYRGASYKDVTSYKTDEQGNVIPFEVDIVADSPNGKIPEVSFVNDYDDQVDEGTISIENHFDKKTGYMNPITPQPEAVPEAEGGPQ